MTTAISIRQLKKSFETVDVFNDFDMDIAVGEITAFFGPNGSGKTTLLNIISGVVAQDSGTISPAGMSSLGLSYIFQNYRQSLLPWRTNFENVSLPLQIQKIHTEEIRQRVQSLQNIFEFKCDWSAYPYQLSGGQQQILAFMRALITEPKFLLIDEPFSALDYENNLRLREHLQRYFVNFKPTVILVTHNIEEAVHLANKIIIVSKKPTKVIQVIDNPLVHPRAIAYLKSSEFNQLKDQVLSVFQEAMRI